jgi:hypothetical protein
MAAGDKAYWSDISNAISPPIVRLVAQAAQTLSTATQAAITFGAGSEDIDTHGYHDTASNTSRVTPTLAGYYRVRGTVIMAASTTVTGLFAAIGKNGTNLAPSDRDRPNTTSNTTHASAEAIVSLNGSTDYVELNATMTGPATLATSAAGSVASVLECQFIRPL